MTGLDPTHHGLRFERVEAPRILPLRTRILRPHLEPPKLCRFDEDEAADTAHLGLFNGEINAQNCVAAVTFFPRAAPRAPDEAALQLRGMCVADSWRQRGLGTRLFESALAPLALLYPGARLVWCNARISAAPFYEKLGFERSSAVFDVEGIGAHVRMRRRLSPARVGGDSSGTQAPEGST